MDSNERYNRLNNRVERLEQKVDNSLTDMNSSINMLSKEVIEIRIINESVNKQQRESLDELKIMIGDLNCDINKVRDKPGARWDLIITAILTATGSMIGTGIIKAIIESLN